MCFSFVCFFFSIRLYFERYCAVSHSLYVCSYIFTHRRSATSAVILHSRAFFLSLSLPSLCLSSFSVFLGIFFIFYFLPPLVFSSLHCTNCLVVFFFSSVSLSLFLSSPLLVTKIALASLAFFKSYLLYLQHHHLCQEIEIIIVSK